MRLFWWTYNGTFRVFCFLNNRLPTFINSFRMLFLGKTSCTSLRHFENPSYSTRGHLNRSASQSLPHRDGNKMLSSTYFSTYPKGGFLQV